MSCVLSWSAATLSDQTGESSAGTEIEKTHADGLKALFFQRAFLTEVEGLSLLTCHLYGAREAARRAGQGQETTHTEEEPGPSGMRQIKGEDTSGGSFPQFIRSFVLCSTQPIFIVAHAGGGSLQGTGKTDPLNSPCPQGT